MAVTWLLHLRHTAVALLLHMAAEWLLHCAYTASTWLLHGHYTTVTPQLPCRLQVNNKDEQLVDLMVSRWGEGFSLGGLGGLPFAGKSGFRAYLHHVPDSGRLLVLFAPHVGIDSEGRIGALQRDGQTEVSKACGAAVGAYKAIQGKKAEAQVRQLLGWRNRSAGETA